MIRKYQCLVEGPSRSLIVDVFTKSTDKDVIKEKALLEAHRDLKEFGVKHDLKDLKPIGFKKRLRKF